MTFEWEDIIGKVLFVAYRDDDMVTAITEDGQEYLFEFDELDTLEKQKEILERFLGESANIDGQNTKIRRLLPDRDAADPWYNGDFERTYTDIRECCENLITTVMERIQ